MNTKQHIHNWPVMDIVQSAFALLYIEKTQYFATILGLVQNQDMKKDECLPLFETKPAKWRVAYWLYVVSMIIAIVLICIYRVTEFPAENELKTWAWSGLFMAELWFILYWFITQSLRCRPVYRTTFKDRLSYRYEEVLPGIDIFVCTANAELEPPLMVVNTVLSVMVYDYPPEKVSVYLSDDGGSELMFYALWEASEFAKLWLPFCRKFNVEPLAPASYFAATQDMPKYHNVTSTEDWQNTKRSYDEMKDRIDESTRLGRIPEELLKQHKGFREWEMGISRSDHQTILQVLIDGRDKTTVDADGKTMPNLVYLAREKRPGHHHNFKAGAMNALIRVSSKISNSPIILNVDCDQYSNNSESIRDALCFFMDDKQNNIAFIQYPQYFDNITKNDVYGNYLRVINELEFRGQDSNGGPMYVGSGCFHRRDALCGEKYGSHSIWKVNDYERQAKESTNHLGEMCKVLADCSYEENSLWGKEIGLKYGCPVEDVITGISIQCKGWRSIHFNPKTKGFLGLAPTTLMETLVQHMRWTTGQFQIFLSQYCPFVYGRGRMPLLLQISYGCYNLWAVNSVPMLYYVIVPSFCLLKGITLFPRLTSPWVAAYAYVFLAKHAYSLGEFVIYGGTLKGWYHEQRMWLYKRLTSYLFGFISTITRVLGFSKLDFVITSKIADEDVMRRYEQEIMEFGMASPMFVVLTTVALFNLITFISVAIRVMVGTDGADLDACGLEMILNVLVVIINIPLLEAVFVRKDKGRMPSSVMFRSLRIATLVYLLAWF